MDKYEIQKVVGQGSYGRAILCRRKKDSKLCIIKQISLAKLSKKEAKMTEQEAQLLGKLAHPNIVAFWESFTASSNLHIVMEFADGGDLDSYIKNYKKKYNGKEMSESQVLNLFVQICLAIKHIHDRKILHRDLKGQNIFLTSSGLCKVGDFGVSRVLRNTVELAATQIGTPYYMSPEIMNNQKYNSKTDIWSLGVILYEMVCLRLPFDGNSMRQLCYNIINSNPLPPPSSFSTPMKELVKDILAKDPRKRPSINNILSRSLIKDRIQNFLNETKIQREFSHTILHGVNVLSAPAPNSILANPQVNPSMNKPIIPSAPAANVIQARPNPISANPQNVKPNIIANPAAKPNPVAIQRPVAVQQQQQPQPTPQQVAAKYKVMAAPPAKPMAQPAAQPPKSVDQIIREILRRDHQAAAAHKPASANQAGRPAAAAAAAPQYKAPVVREDPAKAVYERYKQAQAANQNQPNPFQPVVGKPLAINQRQPVVERKPAVPAANPAPVVQKQPPQSNFAIQQRKVSEPKVEPAKQIVAKKDPVEIPRRPASAPSNPNPVAKVELPSKPAIPVQKRIERASPSPSPSVASSDKSEGVSYRSPKLALQNRPVESADRVQKIDAIIGKAAAVLEVIKQEKIKADQRVNSPYSDVPVHVKGPSPAPASANVNVVAREAPRNNVVPPAPSQNNRPGISPSPSVASSNSEQSPKPAFKADMPWLQNLQNQMGALKNQVQKMQDDRQLTPTPPLAEASEPSPKPSGGQKADMPWLQNLQNQMGALKVQVQKLQDDRNSPAPPGSDEPSVAKPNFKPSPTPALVNEKPPLPVQPQIKQRVPLSAESSQSDKSRPPVRQSFPPEKNNLPPSRKSPSPSIPSSQPKKAVPSAAAKAPSPLVIPSKDNKAKPKAGAGGAKKKAPAPKKAPKTVDSDGPNSKELLEQRKEMRQKHRVGFKEFLKAQRAAKKESHDADDEEDENEEEENDDDEDGDQEGEEDEKQEQEDFEEHDHEEEANDAHEEEEIAVAHSRESPAILKSRSSDANDYKRNAVNRLSSASNDEVAAINYQKSKGVALPTTTTQQQHEKQSPPQQRSSSEKASPLTASITKSQQQNRFLQNPNFGHSINSKEKVNVMVSEDIEILSPPKPVEDPNSNKKKYSPPPAQQATTPPVTNVNNQQQQKKPLSVDTAESSPSTARSQYHIPDNVVDSKNYYKNKHPNHQQQQLQNPTNNEVDELMADACCVFPFFTRSANPNMNNNAPHAKIIPSSPIKGRNMFYEFDEDGKPSNSKNQLPTPDLTAENPLGDFLPPPPSEEAVPAEDEDLLVFSADPGDNDELIEDFGPSVDDMEVEDDFLGKSFVLQVQSEKKTADNGAGGGGGRDLIVDDETALEYSMMLQQMQAILQLPTKNKMNKTLLKSPSSAAAPVNAGGKPLQPIVEDEVAATAMEKVEEGEGDEEEFDDDCFEEESVEFSLTATGEEGEEDNAQIEEDGAEYLQEIDDEVNPDNNGDDDDQKDSKFFQLSQDPASKPSSQQKSTRPTAKAFLTEHLSYSHKIPKPPRKEADGAASFDDQEDDFAAEEEGVPHERDSLGDGENNDSQHQQIFNETIAIEDDQLHVYSRKYSTNELEYYEHLVQESQDLTTKLIDLLSYDVFVNGMTFLASNEMIDESYSEDEILLRLEAILGLENLSYLEDMYTLLNYQQLIQDYQNKNNISPR